MMVPVITEPSFNNSILLSASKSSMTVLMIIVFN
jgi:hypothetical protein